MLLKQIDDKGAVIAWSPLRHRPTLLGVATKEGGGGGFDDYGGDLSIYNVALASRSYSCDLVTRCVYAAISPLAAHRVLRFCCRSCFALH